MGDHLDPIYLIRLASNVFKKTPWNQRPRLILCTTQHAWKWQSSFRNTYILCIQIGSQRRLNTFQLNTWQRLHYVFFGLNSSATSRDLHFWNWSRHLTIITILGGRDFEFISCLCYSQYPKSVTAQNLPDACWHD